jgi:drug/metabolite transporter (DMT)-like permease
MALLGAAIAGLAMAALVLATDPDTHREELFIGLLLIAATGLGWATTLIFGRRTGSPLADTLRALRRGLLFGLACCGAAVLQINNAFNAPNLVFLLLVLLIVEMIFVASRQHPA